MRVTELGPEQEVCLASPFRPSPKAALWLDWVPAALLSLDLTRRWARVGSQETGRRSAGMCCLKRVFLEIVQLKGAPNLIINTQVFRFTRPSARALSHLITPTFRAS